MSQRDRAEEIGCLRRAIAQIEGAPAQGRNAPARVKLGADEGPPFSLDLAFGGGLPTGALYEVVPARANDMAAAAGFALALAARLGRARAGAIVWIGQDFLGPRMRRPLWTGPRRPRARSCPSHPGERRHCARPRLGDGGGAQMPGLRRRDRRILVEPAAGRTRRLAAAPAGGPKQRRLGPLPRSSTY